MLRPLLRNMPVRFLLKLAIARNDSGLRIGDASTGTSTRRCEMPTRIMENKGMLANPIMNLTRQFEVGVDTAFDLRTRRHGEVTIRKRD